MDRIRRAAPHAVPAAVEQAAEVARLEGLDVRRVDVGPGPKVTWAVPVGPDGNEFCVLRALRPEELAGG